MCVVLKIVNICVVIVTGEMVGRLVNNVPGVRDLQFKNERNILLNEYICLERKTDLSAEYL
jgi:hypothetical protein